MASLTRVASRNRRIDVPGEDATEIERVMQGGELQRRLRAAAADRRGARIRPRQMARGDRGRRAGALQRDLRRVEQRQRPAVTRVGEQHRALDGWQAVARAVVREVAVDLDGNVARAARQARRLEVKGAVRDVDLRRHRRCAPAFREQPEAVGDRLDIVAEAHRRAQVLLGQDDELVHGSPSAGVAGRARVLLLPQAGAKGDQHVRRSSSISRRASSRLTPMSRSRITPMSRNNRSSSSASAWRCRLRAIHLRSCRHACPSVAPSAMPSSAGRADVGPNFE
jgi:hypothetical protein